MNDGAAKPLISVVIPTFNRSGIVREAIQSALDQDYRPLEIIVVDDGGSDDTEEVVRAFGEPVRYARQKNAGPAAARNTGAANSAGPMIAFLDSDDLWKPQKLSRQTPLLLAGADIGLVFSSVEFFLDGSGRITSIYYPGDEVSFHQSLGFCIVYVQSSLVRREAFEAIGGFDVTLKGTEDWDFTMRLAMKYRMIGLNETLTRYRVHEGNFSSNPGVMNENLWKALENNSNRHGPDCQECRRAISYTRERIRQGYYKKLIGTAKGYWRSRRPASAAAYALKAICSRPSAGPRLAMKYAGRLVGRSSRTA